MSDKTQNAESGIFRKSSIDRALSPEVLDNYMRVTTPGVWLVLSAILVLICGALCWGVFGRLKTKLPAKAQVKDNTAEVYLISDDEGIELKSGMKVIIDSGETEIFSVSPDNIAYADVDMPDGEYGSEVIIEDISPISFIWN